MLELILEKPLWIGILGGVVSIVATQWWLTSGRREALFIGLGIILLTLLLVAVGIAIETEQESLRAMIYQTADDLQNNRRDEVIATIYEPPSREVLEARDLLKEGIYELNVAKIKKIHALEFSGPPSARKAIVKMNVFVEGRLSGYQVSLPRYVEVTLYRVEQRWQVYNFTHDQPMAGFQVP